MIECLKTNKTISQYQTVVKPKPTQSNYLITFYTQLKTAPCPQYLSPLLFLFIFHRRLSVIILVPIPMSSSVIPVILYTPIGLGTGVLYPPPHTRPELRGNKPTTSELIQCTVCLNLPVSYVYVETILE